VITIVAKSRALPTPRNEGMANIVAATIRLLETTSPKDVTLRDVARESGHGHRLIVEWFGGKGGLFAAVVNETFKTLTSSGEIFFADLALRKEVRIVFEVFNYMQMHHPDFVKEARSTLALNAFRDLLINNTGLSPDKARLAASRLALLLLGIVLFREHFTVSDDEVIQMLRDEFTTTTGLDFMDNPARRLRDK
jgi:AcrR family transcriptional regulator